MRNNKIKPQYENYEDNENKTKHRFLYTIDIDKEKSLKQFPLKIEDIEIFFPYKPYNCQITYMETSKRTIFLIIF